MPWSISHESHHSSFLTLHDWLKQLRCNPDVAPRRNRGRVAYLWNAMSVDFQYVDVYIWSMYMITIVVIIIIITTIPIPYEDKLIFDAIIRFSIFATGGGWFVWSLMKICWCHYQIQHICQRGSWICSSLMKISWCDYPIQHIWQRGWWILDPLWR